MFSLRHLGLKAVKSGVCGPVGVPAEQVAANYPEASGDCTTGIVARLQGIVAAVAGEFSHTGPAEQLNASVLQSSNNQTSALDSIACESECVYSAGMNDYAEYTQAQIAELSEAEYTALVKANYERLVEEWRR